MNKNAYANEIEEAKETLESKWWNEQSSTRSLCCLIAASTSRSSLSSSRSAKTVWTQKASQL